MLSDPVKRKAYDSQRLSQTKGNERDLGLKAKPSYSTQDGSTWPFDPDKIQKAAEEIELRRRRIETNYNQKIEQVKSELKRNLILIGIKEEDARVDYTFLTRDENIQSCFVFLFLGLLAFLGGWGWIGAILVLIALVSAWSAFFESGYSKEQVEKAKSLQERAKSEIELREKEKSSELSQLTLYCRSRIDYFKSLPLESLSPEFISGLSGEDQLFLLTAIKERADAEKLKEDLKLAAGIAVGIGILAVLFGLGGGFYPH